MKYVPAEFPASGLIGDADSMMREFNRAMAIVYKDIDQNNIIDRRVHWVRIAHPVEQWNVSTSIAGFKDFIAMDGATDPPANQIEGMHAVEQTADYTTGKPGVSEDGFAENRPHGEYWETIQDGDSGVRLSLTTLTLGEATELTVIASGQINAGLTTTQFVYRNCCFDVRITDNGYPTGEHVTVSTVVDQGFVPFLASSRKLFLPGDHLFEVQIKIKSGPLLSWQGMGSGARYAYSPDTLDPTGPDADTETTISNTIIAAYGFVR